MRFFEQYKKGSGNFGTYLLSIALIMSAFVISNVIVALLIGFDTEILKETQENKTYVLFLKLLPSVILVGTILVVIKFLHQRPILSIFTARDSFSWRRFFESFGIWTLVMTILLVIGFQMDGNYAWNFDARKFFPLLLIALLFMPFQVGMEELLFRGYLYQGFGSMFKHGGLAMLLSALLFGVFHLANPEVAQFGYKVLPFYFGSALILGLLSHLDDGLELSLGFHTSNNLFLTLITSNNWGALQTDALFMETGELAFGWGQWITSGIAYPLFLLIFAWRYKWSNIKQKLFLKSL